MAQVTLEQLTADIWVVSLFGEHDISMVDALRDSLAEAFTHDPRLIIDLTEATFVDSTVLGVLFAFVNQSASTAAGVTRAGRHVRKHRRPNPRAGRVHAADRRNLPQPRRAARGMAGRRPPHAP